ncbi:MAG: protein kinase domain-containing protein [Chlamydiia bacterium]
MSISTTTSVLHQIPLCLIKPANPVTRCSRLIDIFKKIKKRAFSESEKSQVRALFQKLYPGKDPGSITEHKITKPNGKKRRLLVLSSAFETGGEKSIQLCATRSCTGALKYWAMRIPHRHTQTHHRSKIKGDHPIPFSRKVEFEASRKRENGRITPRTLFFDRFTLQRLAMNGDLHGYAIKITPERKALFAKKILTACIAYWNEGLIHGDIKLENILVDEDENVFLTDFGFADKSSPKELRIISGTTRALIPRCIHTTKRRADYYALGIALFELYLGRPYAVNSKNSLSREFQDSQKEFYIPALRRALISFESKQPKSPLDERIFQFTKRLIKEAHVVKLKDIKTFAATLNL